jgi:hypothetical protein
MLLGRNPDGSDGYVGMSPEGPVSMRQAYMDPSCPSRVVPGCREEGSSYDPLHPPCDTVGQWFAWPSRRILGLARRFDESYGNSVVRSICRVDHAEAMQAIGTAISRRLCR